MQHIIQEWEEKKREEFLKDIGNQIDMYDDGSPIYPAKIHDVYDYFLSQLPSLLTLLEEQVGGDFMYCKSGCGCPFPYGNGSHEYDCVWETDVQISEERSRIRTLLAQAKQQLL